MISHSGQVFLVYGVHPIYDKNDKEATSSLKVSVISRLPLVVRDGKRFDNKLALLDQRVLGRTKTTWFEWIEAMQVFLESAVGVVFICQKFAKFGAST